MSKQEAKLYLDDIKESIKRIEDYTDGLDFEDFIKDTMMLDAVVRNLTIIGEAAKNISKEIKLENSQVAWSEAVSMRNKITHEYFGVDEEILWKTIKEDLPVLRKQILKILKNYGKSK